MPGPDITTQLADINRARKDLANLERAVEKLRVQRLDLIAKRETAFGTGATDQAAQLDQQITQLDTDLAGQRDDRRTLLGQLGGLSDALLAALTPEGLITTLDGRLPVAMLPVRIETRFSDTTTLRVRVFPDQLHIDGHDPALTAEELRWARRYWRARWQAGLDDTDAAQTAWRTLTSKFRPGRASWLVTATKPTNTPNDGEPAFPTVPARASTWSKPPTARALPDRFCVIGLSKQGNQWLEQFRQWGRHVPDELVVAPTPLEMDAPAADGRLPYDERTQWLVDPAVAQDQGALIEVTHASLAGGVDRLVVLGVDWTQTPDDGAQNLESLLQAQRYAGHFAFVPQGVPTNNTGNGRAGFTSDPEAETTAHDPTTPPVAGDQWSAGRRLATRLGLPANSLDGVHGADLREHAWASALADALWRGTAGFYLTDLLDPLADDPQIDANLREFTSRNVFAAGPLPTLRVGSQPYGVLPLVPARRYDPGADPATNLVHRVATVLRDIITPAIENVPHLRRAGEEEDVDAVLLALLQRSPVPSTFRFRPLTGPILSKNLSIGAWDRMNDWQRKWTSAMWSRLGVTQSVRLNELTHGESHPLPVPLVAKPGEVNPTAYLTEIADHTADQNGRKALNLRENSVALLEALAACSAVYELDRTALQVIVAVFDPERPELQALPALKKLAIATPDMLRIEATPAVPAQTLDFTSGRQLADSVISGISNAPLGEFITTTFAGKIDQIVDLLDAPTDPFHWLARHQVALRTLAEAPPEQLEWAFRGFLDLFSTRLDAWFTGLATHRLTACREADPSGVHIGCWGFVENLRRDVGTAAESVGFVHAPSLPHAASTALLRNGRLADQTADGDVFDLQITSDRVRIARWLLEGVNQGQRLAALLGYRLERSLRQSGVDMMRYQMPLRRTAPLRGPKVPPEEPVEVLAARDVVDGVALLDRWRADPDALLADITEQAGLGSLPANDSKRLRQVIEDTHAAYDAVSDLLIAESVHQAATGNLDRSGAALSAHDRHGRAPEPDFTASPRSGHTVSNRVAIVAQSAATPDGWPRDARSRAEPLLNAWAASLLGKPQDWKFAAELRTTPTGKPTLLTPITLADLGLSPLSTILATQRTGDGKPSELEQRITLASTANSPTDPDAVLTLLPGAGNRGLAALTILAEWAARVCGNEPLTAADFAPTTAVAAAESSPGTVDVAEIAARVATTRTAFNDARTALEDATTSTQRVKAALHNRGCSWGRKPPVSSSDLAM